MYWVVKEKTGERERSYSSSPVLVDILWLMTLTKALEPLRYQGLLCIMCLCTICTGTVGKGFEACVYMGLGQKNRPPVSSLSRKGLGVMECPSDPLLRIVYPSLLCPKR